MASFLLNPMFLWCQGQLPTQWELTSDPDSEVYILSAHDPAAENPGNVQPLVPAMEAMQSEDRCLENKNSLVNWESFLFAIGAHRKPLSKAGSHAEGTLKRSNKGGLCTQALLHALQALRLQDAALRPERMRRRRRRRDGDQSVAADDGYGEDSLAPMADLALEELLPAMQAVLWQRGLKSGAILSLRSSRSLLSSRPVAGRPCDRSAAGMAVGARLHHLLPPWLGRDASSSSHPRALLVGICYRSIPYAHWHLEGPWNDVQDLRSWLTRSLGWPDHGIRLLTDDGLGHGLPTKQGLVDGLKWLLDVEDSCGLLHFCGHGAPGELLPLDWQTHGTVADSLLSSLISKHLSATSSFTAIVDCCESSHLFKDLLPHAFQVGPGFDC